MGKNDCEKKKCHKTSIGGQAVIEGVMMLGPKKRAISVRKPDGEIITDIKELDSALHKSKILKLPILRGVVSFFNSLVMGTKALMFSAELVDVEDDETKEKKKEMTQEEIEKEEKKQSKIMSVAIMGSVIISLLFSVGLFIMLPAFLVGLLRDLCFPTIPNILATLIEGVVRITIFVVYIFLASLMKDIRRVFEYHGAEHKSIFCYESGEELTVENVKKFKRFHPRCGTALMFVIILISILVSAIIPAGISQWLRMALKLLTLPLTVGIGYEYVMYAGKHDNPVTRFFSAPGLWMQRITTKEPDDSQIEIAITALKLSMPSVFPDFAPENGKMFEEETKEADNDEKNG